MQFYSPCVLMESPSTDPFRICLLSDTHLGIDMPMRPRIKRLRRGHDFRNNLLRVLDYAIYACADCVIHCGDVFYRSRIPPHVTADAFELLAGVAQRGIPVMVVPGNHERSVIPNGLLSYRDGVTVFDVPSHVTIKAKGLTIGFGGFPYAQDAGKRLRERVEQTGLLGTAADIRILCMHQAVEGARVGVQNYRFGSGFDIISRTAIPKGIDAVFAGHVHRAQCLESIPTDSGQSPIPIIFPGSIERTGFAERLEEKGFTTVEIQRDPGGKVIMQRYFHRLPTRPMFCIDLNLSSLDPSVILDTLSARVASLPADAVVQIRCAGNIRRCLRIPSIADIRAAVPQTMIVSVRCLYENDD
ncbi:metallophosphoesterase [bacterium]|nr:metallophosphoesterase [candidate division CSSED10-310 bacterium]